jgi:hypothetical protein
MNMNMKKSFLAKLSALVCVLVGLNLSCTNLDEELFDQVSGDSFFRTNEEFIAALGASYSSLYGYMTNANMFSLQEVTSDEMVVPTRGQDWDDGGNWRRLHLQSYTFEDDRIRDGWSFLYNGVSTCNRLIFQFEEVGAEGSDAFIAELKVLRALFYLWLVDTYGNVPVVTSFDVPEGFSPPTVPRAQVYDFIDAELTANVPLLDRAVSRATYGRVNYWTGKAIQTKLYLNAQVYKGAPEWQKAADAAKEIIDSGRFSLAGNFFANFVTQNQNSPEFIFAIPYDEVFARGFNMPQMTLHYASQGTYNLRDQPWNGFCSLQEFYESFEDDDVRKASFIVGPQFNVDGTPALDDGFEVPSSEFAGDPDGPQVNFTPEINQLTPRALRQAGARVGKWEFRIGALPDLSNDFAIFRYADVLLMRAEALFRLGQTTGEALELVNQVRRRAGVADFTVLNADNLLAERGRELFAEAWRRSDLIRFDQYNKAWWAKPATDATKKIFPIPRGQLQANPNLTQNPGY